ncbi:MAG: hypothetical protein R3C28_33265 [Pirellulaceae bacterium]
MTAQSSNKDLDYFAGSAPKLQVYREEPTKDAHPFVMHLPCEVADGVTEVVIGELPEHKDKKFRIVATMDGHQSETQEVDTGLLVDGQSILPIILEPERQAFVVRVYPADEAPDGILIGGDEVSKRTSTVNEQEYAEYRKELAVGTKTPDIDVQCPGYEVRKEDANYPEIGIWGAMQTVYLTKSQVRRLRRIDTVLSLSERRMAKTYRDYA